MPAKRLSMRKIKDVLRLCWGQGLSKRKAARSCGVSRPAVDEYLRRAEAAGLCWPLPAGLDDGALERLLFPPPPALPAGERGVPDWSHIHQELKRKGVTLFLLWQEYRQRYPHGYQYTWFCQHYRTWCGKLDLVMRQTHQAGEKLFVDYAGTRVVITDPSTGEVREAAVFVAALGASNYTYAEATWSQGLEDWIGAHVRCFAYLGGVPELVVPDNLRAGVSKAHRYEPDINPTYQDMATHYGVASHRRAYHKARHTTVTAHMPEAHRQAGEWSPQRLGRWAAKVGPATETLILSVLSARKHPQQAYRSCLGILRLDNSYGKDRLEAACQRALTLGSHSYKSIESILRHGLDRQPLAEQTEAALPEDHDNIRGPAYYH